MLKVMTIVALVLSSFLPLILWSFFAIRSRYLSVVCLLLAVLASLGSIAFASLAQVILDPVRAFFPLMGSVLFSSFVESALIEELSKFALLYWLVSSPLVHRLCGDGRYCGERQCKSEARWILSCALTLGLGFSAFETVAYAVRNPDIVWLRSITALFVHGSTAVAAGGFVASIGRRAASSLTLFILAIALHGAYNAALLIAGFVPAAFIVLLLIGLAVHVRGKYSAS